MDLLGYLLDVDMVGLGSQKPLTECPCDTRVEKLADIVLAEAFPRRTSNCKQKQWPYYGHTEHVPRG